MSSRLVKKRSSHEAGIAELLCRLKKQSRGSAQSDSDTNNTLIVPQSDNSTQSNMDVDALILSQMRGRQHRKEQAIWNGEWIRRDPIKCCFCDREISASRRCFFCGHKPCEYYFYYDKDPILVVDCIPNANHDELWEKVREFVESSRCREKRKSDSVLT